MKTPRSVIRFAILLFLQVGALVGQAQDMVPLNLRFERVNLSNGRVLKNATLTSINRGSDLVYVLEDRELKPYLRALFPGFVTSRIDNRLKEYPAPKSSSQSKPRSADRSEPSTPSRSNPIGSPERNAADRAAIEAAVAAKAESDALRHFRCGPRTGSGYTTTTQSEVELDGPEAIPGWPGRYRVEVIVEAKSPSRVKVLEVNIDWTPSR